MLRARLLVFATVLSGCENGTPLGACLLNCEIGLATEIISGNSAPITSSQEENLGAQTASGAGTN